MVSIVGASLFGDSVQDVFLLFPFVIVGLVVRTLVVLPVFGLRSLIVSFLQGQNFLLSLIILGGFLLASNWLRYAFLDFRDFRFGELGHLVIGVIYEFVHHCGLLFPKVLNQRIHELLQFL